MAAKEQEKLASKLEELKEDEENRRTGVLRKKIESAKKRYNELIPIIQKLFEEKIAGTLPQEVFDELVAKYNSERETLGKQIASFENELQKIESTANTVEKWIENMLKVLDIKELTRDILVTLIDRIEVHLPERVNNKKQYRISIYYKFMESVESKELDAA